MPQYQGCLYVNMLILHVYNIYNLFGPATSSCIICYYGNHNLEQALNSELLMTENVLNSDRLQ